MTSSSTAPGFCHLHAHSHYTLLAGASSPEELARRAAGLGLPRAAITDTNALYAAVPFSKACRNAGVEPILGAHLEEKGKHAVLLVRDSEGYRNLCTLLTRRQLAPRFSFCRDIVELRRGLAVLVHDPGLLARLARHLGRGQLFAEVVPHGRIRPGSSGEAGETAGAGSHGRSDPPPLYSPASVLHAAERLGLRAVVTAAAYMSEPGAFPVHRLLSAIRRTTTLAALRRDSLASARSFMNTPAALASLLPDTRSAREAMGCSAAVAAECGFRIAPSAPRFPTVDLDPGETPYSRLCRLVLDRALQLYRPIRPDVMKRIEKELRIIDSMGFSSYFLIVHDLVAHARSRKIPAVGRGSAAGSMVAFLLGVTRVDPIEHDLYFERFLNPQRTGCPDIDVDICWKRRDEVIDYVYRKYGAEHVAMISTFVTYRFRSAFRDAALACGAAPAHVNRLSRLLPWRLNGDPEETIAAHPEARRFPLRQEPYAAALRGAAAINGFPRHLSIHAGGLVVGCEPLSTLVPLERAAKGIVVSQYDMDPAEEIGLVKIDILGQRGLSAVADAVKWVHEIGGREVDLHALSGKDSAAASLLRVGRTLGCFQIESPAIRGLLTQMKASNRSDLIAAIALIRPGPSSGGMKDVFLRRHLGYEEQEQNDPLPRSTLRATHGVMLYQEDVLRVARDAAGFTLAEADSLRKAITGKRSPERMAALRERFIEGGVERGLSRKDAGAIFRSVERFASYSFCKAHAATYGTIAFEAAFLKAHFPAEMLAAVMANHAGFYRTGVYVEEARRLGIRILPPCVNRSAPGFRPEGPVSSGGAAGAVRVGLRSVKGLSEATIAAIVQQRNRKDFQSLDGFLRRVAPPRNEAESLLLSGGFDFTGISRPGLLWQLKAAAGEALCSRSRCREGEELFPQPPPAPLSPLPRIPDYSTAKKLEIEFEQLGFTPTAHPLSLFTAAAARERTTPCSRIPARAGRRVRVAAWVVTSRRIRTGTGRMMKFLTLEDTTGIVEAVLFPSLYSRLGPASRGRGPFLVEGRVESRLGFPSLNVTALRPLE